MMTLNFFSITTITFFRSIVNLFLTSKCSDVITTERPRIMALFCKIYGAAEMKELSLNDASPALNSLTLFKVSKVLNEQFEEIETRSMTPIDLNRGWTEGMNEFLCNYVIFVFFYSDFAVFSDTFERLLTIHGKILERNSTATSLDYSDSLIYGMMLMNCRNESKIIGSFRAYVNYSERCFDMYPSNRRLFGFYSRAKRCGVDSLNVRKMFEKLTKKSADVAPWLNYLEYEKQRMLITNVVHKKQVKCFLVFYFLLKSGRLFRVKFKT